MRWGPEPAASSLKDTNPGIATRLHLGYGTVKSHVSHLLTRLGCRYRAQLVMDAYESGHTLPGNA